MPVPYTPNPPNERPPSKRDFHLPTRQPWANDAVTRQHTEALSAFGEFTMFILMWDIDDLRIGRVDRCHLCYEGSKVPTEVAKVYNQPTLARCPSCFGTTFEGGFKARIVRLALWDYSEETDSTPVRGATTSQSAKVQTTNDFHMRDGDYAFRGDGTRWQIDGSSTSRIRDGFGMPTRAESSPGFQYSDCHREEQTATSFIIPPLTHTELGEILLNPPNKSYPWFPPDFSEFEEIRGPLLEEIQD